jgi:hypothetical protein
MLDCSGDWRMVTTNIYMFEVIKGQLGPVSEKLAHLRRFL